MNGNNNQYEQRPQENKMGVMPVGRLLFSMSVPMILSMLVMALYRAKLIPARYSRAK